MVSMGSKYPTVVLRCILTASGLGFRSRTTTPISVVVHRLHGPEAGLRCLVPVGRTPLKDHYSYMLDPPIHCTEGCRWSPGARLRID